MVGILCGGFEKNSLKAAGCIVIFRDPPDLLKNYEHSSLGMIEASRESTAHLLKRPILSLREIP